MLFTTLVLDLELSTNHNSESNKILLDVQRHQFGAVVQFFRDLCLYHPLYPDDRNRKSLKRCTVGQK